MSGSFNTVGRIVHGNGCVNELANEVEKLGGSRVLVVTDPGLKSAGILGVIEAVLDRAKLAHSVFAEVRADPDVAVAEASIESARAFQPDVILGLGGGSSLDVSKVTSVMMTNPGAVHDYFGMELVPAPGIPLVLVPTTAGTGSEVTSICVLGDPRDDVKKAIVSRHMFARTVLLDPELTRRLPAAVTAQTGMDALVHGIESYTGIRATVFSDTLSLRAIRIIAGNLRDAFATGEPAARENMLYASCLAGMAFSNTQNALVHALALAIGGKFHLPHGLLTAFICPWVMEYNLPAVHQKYGDIARAFGKKTDGLSEAEAARLAVVAVKELVADLGISTRLGTYGVPRNELAGLARATIGAARLIGNNPREVTGAAVVELLEANY